MVAEYTVKINGKWYRAGDELPSDLTPEEPKKLNKKDITFMKVNDLRSLAAEHGIENPEDLNGATLKQLLIEKLGL